MKWTLPSAAILSLMVLGCDAPPETIAGKIQAGVEKACAFHADYQWLTDVVVKADLTVQAVNTMVTKICTGIVEARAVTTYSLVKPRCPYGEITIDGKTVCIEGKPVDSDKRSG